MSEPASGSTSARPPASGAPLAAKELARAASRTRMRARPGVAASACEKSEILTAWIGTSASRAMRASTGTK